MKFDRDLNEKIEQARYHLYKTHEYFAHILFHTKTMFTDKIPTMGVGFKGTNIMLVINPDFVKNLSTEEIAAVLYHEAQHIVFGHLSGNTLDTKSIIENVAKDIVINQTNPLLKSIRNTSDMAKNACWHDDEMFNFEEDRTFEYYYNKLKEKQNEQQKAKPGKEDGDSSNQSGEGMSHDFDSHDLSEVDPEFDKQIPDNIKKSILRGILNDAIKNTKSGSIPGSALDTLEALKPAQISWKRLLRNFVGQKIGVLQRVTRSRPNRRLGTLLPGKRLKPTAKIVFCQDTSGSTSKELHEQVAAEMLAINKKYNAEIIVIQSDYSIQDEFKLKKGKTITHIKGRGGTSYVDALNRAKELKPDMVIYFGDGDPADHPETFNIPLLWVTDTGNKPTPYGKVLKVDI